MNKKATRFFIFIISISLQEQQHEKNGTTYAMKRKISPRVKQTNSTEYSDTDTQRGQYEEHLNASVEQTKSSHNFCTSITIQAQGFRNVEHCYRSFIAAQAKHVQDYLMDSEFLLLFLCIHLQKSLKCMYLFSGSNK